MGTIVVSLAGEYRESDALPRYRSGRDISLYYPISLPCL